MTDFLGQIEFASTTDADRWLEIQCFLLRLPERHRNRWRDSVSAELRRIGSEEDHEYLLEIEYFKHDLVFDGLRGSIRAQGLRLKQHHEDLGDSVGGLLERASCLSALCLFFARHDAKARHALEDLRRSNTYALVGKELDDYSNWVNNRLNLLKQAVKEQDDPAFEFRAWIRHAESVLSLVYEPPAEPDSSWWSRIHSDVQELVEDARVRNECRGAEIDVLWLRGSHKEQRQWTTEQDIMIDRSFGRAEVVACLRPFVRIDNERRPGRVIYSRY